MTALLFMGLCILVLITLVDGFMYVCRKHFGFDDPLFKALEYFGWATFVFGAVFIALLALGVIK